MHLSEQQRTLSWEEHFLALLFISGVKIHIQNISLFFMIFFCMTPVMKPIRA